MLDKKMTVLDTPDGRYPVVCDFNTLEYLQTEYGSIQSYQNRISGITRGKDGKDMLVLNNVSVHALLDGLTHMINEGIDIQNESGKPLTDHVTVRQTGRIMRRAELSLAELTTLVLSGIADCIMPKKKETSPQTGSAGKQKSTSHGYCLWGKICSVFRKKK